MQSGRRRKLKKMSPPEKLRLLSFRHSRVMMPMFKVYIIILEVLVPFVVQSSLYSNFFLFVSFSESVSWLLLLLVLVEILCVCPASFVHDSECIATIISSNSLLWLYPFFFFFLYDGTTLQHYKTKDVIWRKCIPLNSEEKFAYTYLAREDGFTFRILFPPERKSLAQDLINPKNRFLFSLELSVTQDIYCIEKKIS